MPQIRALQIQHLARCGARGILKVMCSCNKEYYSSREDQHISNNEVFKCIIKPVYFNNPLNKSSFYYLTQNHTSCFANPAIPAALAVCIHEQL